jgi:hypothetical protein
MVNTTDIGSEERAEQREQLVGEESKVCSSTFPNGEERRRNIVVHHHASTVVTSDTRVPEREPSG